MAFDQIVGPIIQLIDTIFIYLNSLIYDFISFLYQIFIAIAGAQIFTSDQYQKLANNVYIVIGVLSLFLIAYALLRAIINPDNSSKGEYAVGKIVPNVIKVVLLIGFVPTIFNLAYKIQDVVINTNIIPKLILGEDNFNKTNGESADGFSYFQNGRALSNIIFTGFMYPKDGFEASEIEINSCHFPAPTCDGVGNNKSISTVAQAVSTVSGFTIFGPLSFLVGDKVGDAVDRVVDHFNGDDSAYTFEMAVVEVSAGTKNFQVYANFGDKIHGEEGDRKLEYNGIFQLIAGILVVYIFINYCIDIGVRAIKLGYYQLIAPIPILTILVPGQNKVFNNWLKSTVSTFLDLFMRIAVIFFALFAIQNLPNLNAMWDNSMFANNGAVRAFAKVFIIIGILIFVKQAPKFFADLFGLQSSSFKLGIKDKLGEMFGVGGAVKRSLSSAEGGISGALGGAYSSMTNRGDIKKGAANGFWNGLKGGGKQFDKQRRSAYTLMGGKGQPGWFGGQNYIERRADRYTNNLRDDYKDRILSTRVNAAEDYTNPNSKIKKFYDNQLTDLQAKQEAKIKNNEAIKNAAEADLNTVKNVFDETKESSLDNIKSSMHTLNTGSANKFLQSYDAFTNQKEMNLNDMKSAITKTESINAEAINSAKVAFNNGKAGELQKMRADMQQAEINFNSDKAKTLDSLNKQLVEQKALGNTARIEELNNEISRVSATSFDRRTYEDNIRNYESAEFEDTDAYKQIKLKQDFEINQMKKDYDEIKNSSFKYTRQYEDLYTGASEEERTLFNKFVDVETSKVEDTKEYQKANETYQKAMDEYQQSYDELHKKTENIIRHVYDSNTKKLKEAVYNPYATSEEDKYIDPKDYEAVKAARVTAVVKKASEEAVKDLKDRDETFKNDEKIFNARVKEKANEAWFNSDEGQHMNMIFGKNAKNIAKGIDFSGPKGGDDKK